MVVVVVLLLEEAARACSSHFLNLACHCCFRVEIASSHSLLITFAISILHNMRRRTYYTAVHAAAHALCYVTRAGACIALKYVRRHKFYNEIRAPAYVFTKIRAPEHVLQ